jgi:hypothetical protein
MNEPFEDLPPLPQAGSTDWLFIRRDDDGTPVYVDVAGALRVAERVVRVWVKYVPPKEGAARREAENYLAETGNDGARLAYVLQPWELNLETDQAADLGIVFSDDGDRVIAAIRFQEPTRRDCEAGTLQAALRAAVNGIWRQDRPGADPVLHERLVEKLKELNRAFEEFETCEGEQPRPSGK